MAKVALLIGVSEYEPGLTPLPAATNDVEAMRQVLHNPEIGGFDEVKVLINPQQHEMAVAIETLFDGRQRDDLILLFFSGHGIKDENGKLYFATCNTCKTDRGVLVKATTVPANFVHEVMSNSRSKREVVILDCCFSGAFAEGLLARDDGFVDVRNQLGGEGRAVLTSSTSTQYSFEQQGADISTYTRYIVEGLKTGAADRDEDGWISVDELHEYAGKKVQEAAPAMKPEIYAIKEGYKIYLAKAPVDDPNLQYRREVEHWVKRGNGEISFIGRAALDGLQDRLQLTPEQTAAIETEVLAPIEVYKKKLHRYEQAYRNEIERNFPLSDQARADLNRLQQMSGLRDEDIALIEAPINTEQPPTSAPPPPDKNFLYYLRQYIFGVIGLVIGGTVVYFFLHRDPSPVTQPTENSCAKETYSLNDNVSLGEEILEKQDTNPDKEAGAQAFAKGDCQTAIEKFNLYRKANLTDPEALIYLNNAKARQKGDRLKIAVSVPIGTTINNAKEMLRGVAQAQDEVNNSGGINGKLLEVAIANDDNDTDEAQNIAKHFVQDRSILAVVGHNASEAAVPAAYVYKSGKLVMISPTSFDQRLSGLSNYIFRIVSTNNLVKSLSNYKINSAATSNVVICVDAESPDNKWFADEYAKAIEQTNGKINPTNCNFSDSSFDSNVILSQAIKSGANGLFLAPHISKINKALELARANQGRLPLFSSPTMYTQQTLAEGKADINGMILAAPWHPQAIPDNPFGQKAQALWGGRVNWRTATTYDGTLALIAGLKQASTREELQKVLHSSNFSVEGATGKIQFEQSGDRINNRIFLVKVQQKAGTNEYEFVLLPN
ncbi:ABC transporter substrate-binding protein [Nostocaceae cyanobacterium CENA369]|uniref:ABC transporter substrate-binding protein n=1 Tax=Dendronalium phyllosphericum CENA369 TaxID=1725256 RepID=A0A8J7LE27_9NOST|nr:ABC transporter substrate-binding protein [Dendronalium phyllosphericum]MBH8572359.1 ABC transporter substrate-binding protein [Dendronalium phyllosphericum CENA369]